MLDLQTDQTTAMMTIYLPYIRSKAAAGFPEYSFRMNVRRALKDSKPRPRIIMTSRRLSGSLMTAELAGLSGRGQGLRFCGWVIITT